MLARRFRLLIKSKSNKAQGRKMKSRIKDQKSKMSVYEYSDFNLPSAFCSLAHLAILLSEEKLGRGRKPCLNWLREDTECTNLLLSLRGYNFLIHFPF